MEENVKGRRYKSNDTFGSKWQIDEQTSSKQNIRRGKQHLSTKILDWKKKIWNNIQQSKHLIRLIWLINKIPIHTT